MQRKTDKPMKIMLLFGKQAPKIYEDLSKDPSAIIYPHYEKESHTHKHSTFFFLDVENADCRYHIVCVEPDASQHHQKEGYEEKLKNTVKKVDIVVLCPPSLRECSDCFRDTINQYETVFKKRFGAPNQQPEFVTVRPDYHEKLKNDKNKLTAFLTNCFYHPTHLTRNYSTHFGVRRIPQEKKEDDLQQGATLAIKAPECRV